MSEAERIAMGLNTLLSHRRWIPIQIEDMATAGVRVYCQGAENRPCVDVTEFSLLEALEKAAKEVRGC